MKTSFFASLAVIATTAVLTLSIKDSSLESLRANALESDTKCVETTNCDCKSPSTGTIYNGYKLKNIGTEIE